MTPYEQQILELVASNNQMLASIYVLLLFVLGCFGAVFVCYVLYKFLRKFF